MEVIRVNERSSSGTEVSTLILHRVRWNLTTIALLSNEIKSKDQYHGHTQTYNFASPPDAPEKSTAFTFFTVPLPVKSRLRFPRLSHSPSSLSRI